VASQLSPLNVWFVAGRNPNVDGHFPNVETGYEMKKIFWPTFDLVAEHYLHIGM